MAFMLRLRNPAAPAAVLHVVFLVIFLRRVERCRECDLSGDRAGNSATFRESCRGFACRAFLLGCGEENCGAILAANRAACSESVIVAALVVAAVVAAVIVAVIVAVVVAGLIIAVASG